MQTKANTAMPRMFIIVSVALGLLLAAFSIASGSNPLVQPDLTVYQQQLQSNPVTSEQLAGWMAEGKRDFEVAGFLDTEACADQKKMIRLLKCYDKANLGDAAWIRKTFDNLQMPIIVYGSQSDDGLEAAAQLRHYGYDVRYLDGGFNGFAAKILNPGLSGDDQGVQPEVKAMAQFLAGNDPLLKRKGQKYLLAGAKNTVEEEEEEVELGGDEEQQEEGC
ncbi:MAG: rhodanese-like domain-containing protein [bacterium]